MRCLEACHIKPVKDCIDDNEKSDINNILILSSNIHKYFDS